jgi:transcriptional regulator with XRE-family HTH domain
MQYFFTFFYIFATLFQRRAMVAVKKKIQKCCMPVPPARKMLYMINGKAVRDARISAGFRTQSDLAAKIGCSRNTISRAENGLGGTGILQQIAAAMDVPPRALMEVSVESASAPMTGQERELLSAFRKLDTVLQARAAGFVFGLAAGGGTEEIALLGAELSSDLAAAEAHRQTLESQPHQQTGDTSA